MRAAARRAYSGQRIVSRSVAVVAALAMVSGAGVMTSAAVEEPAPGATISQDCFYADDVTTDPNVMRVQVILAPGYLYDVTINGAPAAPNGGGTFDTTTSTEPTPFDIDIAATSAAQTDDVIVRQGGVQLAQVEAGTGSCYPVATELTIASIPTSVARGQSITVSGQLTRSDAGPSVEGELVEIYRHFVDSPSAEWATLDTVATDVEGRISISTAPSRDAEYRMLHRGTARFAESTSDVTSPVDVRQPSKLLISRSTSWITAGRSAEIRGQLLAGSTGAPGLPVILQRRFVGSSSWASVKVMDTGSTGQVRFPVTPIRNTDYRLRHSDSFAQVSLTSSSSRVSVRPSLTLTTSNLTGLVGRTATFRGSVNPHYKQEVRLQQLVSGTWRTVAQKRVGSSGGYYFSVTPGATGARTYRIYVPPTGKNLVAISAYKRTVRYAAKITSIHYNAAGDDRYNLNGEYAVVKNTGSVTINLRDWRLNATPQVKVLPSYTLRPGSSVRLYTGSGSLRSGRIYLGFKAPIWNNDGDVGRLYDRYGYRASVFSYS